MNAQAITHSEWTEYIRQYLDNLDVKCSSKNVYRKALNQWLSFVKNIDNRSGVNLTLLYKQSLVSRGLSPYTICVYLSTIKSFFRYLEDSQIIERNIAKSVRIKKPRSTRQALTKDEVIKLLKLDFSDDIEALRNKAILYLKIYTGIRDISIIQANVEDLTLAEDEQTNILFYQGKGRVSADDFVVLTDEVYLPIKNYLSKRKNLNPKAPLFASLCERDNIRLSTQTTRKIVKDLFIKCGIRDKTPHSLRHSCVSFAICSGASIQDVRDMAGHVNIQTTMGYYHANSRLTAPAESSVARYLAS
ncbi:MAG: tyrosine-type recombinase/integrase [Candidatus Omnitrophica bacterium]|nr:tyrosine-type recombinase/integrase [Candidatus Omnitrophota bacterium]